jgi:hypothetical protein
MRIVSLLTVLVAVTAGACGGSTTGTGEAGGDPPNGTRPPSSDDLPTPDQPPPLPRIVGADCPSPTTVLVPSGGLIARSAGSVLRLRLVYQGSSMGLTDLRGADMVLPKDAGPFKPGEVAGYWVEVQSAAKATLYQRTFQDPTNQEGFPGPNGEGFSNSTIDRCVAKTFAVDVPNDADVRDVVIFGSPYGTNQGAVELARFSIK